MKAPVFPAQVNIPRKAPEPRNFGEDDESHADGGDDEPKG